LTSTTELAAWIRLSKTGASARRLNGLLERIGAPEAVFELNSEQLASAAGCSLSVAERLLDPAHAATASDLEQIERLGLQLVPRGDPCYPALLNEIYDPPPLLYVRGTVGPEDRHAVAVVGSRSGTPYGRTVAERLARELAAAGVTLVSGLARGIDTAAHRGALAGGGRTLAVLGCGVDVPYPWGNRTLADQIITSGALISEYPVGTAPDAWHFPSRNRIISGLSLGVVIVEGRAGSGALITAACAVEQNREVFAVPGAITNPLSQGPHQLIRDGARLVETVDDILTELRLRAPGAQPELPLAEPELEPAERALWLHLGSEPKHIDDLILETDLPPASISATLMMLEIKGAARRLPGNYFTRA
jgi:DNA processing protein